MTAAFTGKPLNLYTCILSEACHHLEPNNFLNRTWTSDGPQRKT
jgi:hypothetical protein